ncbi:MAG: DUF4430 domain-containing protein [Candidatus Geothermincolia bacterium]
MDDRKKKALIYAVIAVLVAAGLFVGLRGCTAMPWNSKAASGGMVSVSITQDFGRRIVKTGQVRPRSGATAMDLLKEIATVRTEYGGGFVSSIDGLSSTAEPGSRKDWFYYVNGILSGEGSGQFVVRAGDRVWWDLHDWSAGSFMAAVTGSYPQPFSRGYSKEPQKTTAVYGDGMESLARDTGKHLSAGGADVIYSGDARGFQKGAAGPSIVFMTVKEAEGTRWVTRSLGPPGKPGSLLSIEGGRLVALDKAGNPSPAPSELEAAVIATGTGMGDACPVWLVLCDGEAGAALARQVLVTRPGQLELKVGVAMDSSGRTYPLPR